MQILSVLQEHFRQVLSGWVEDPEKYVQMIAPARDSRNGDYQANLAMSLAKSLGRKPQEVAQEIVGKLDMADMWLQPEVAGPGFINLRLQDDFLASSLPQVASGENLSVDKCENSKTFVIDYSSPNVAKPMHVGHIRTTVIGDALARILRFLGHQVISDNHLGDWGTQFGMIIYGYRNFRDDAAFEQQPVAELSRIYRAVQAIVGYQSALPKVTEAEQKVATAQKQLDDLEANPDPDAKAQKKARKAALRSLNNAKEDLEGLQAKVEAVSSAPDLLELAEQHPAIEKKSQLETAKLHSGDEENLDLWKKFVPISLQEIDSAYERLDIKFDHTFGESFYHPMLPGVVQKLTEQGLAREDNGAICVFLDEFATPMIIQKSDGAFLYSTTDLATIDYRMEHFKPDAILYVVDHRQGEHFEKLFAAARKIGYEDVELNHVSFGTVLGKDGKPFKTRSGTVMGLDLLLDEAVQAAYSVVCDPERLANSGLQDLTEEEKLHIANTVGLGAIKYSDLSHNRVNDYKFDIGEMVQLTGDTGTYIQYMYARTQSIIAKSGVDVNCKIVADFPVQLAEPAERALVLQLLQFEDALNQSVESYYPNVLTAYLYGLAKQFASFFIECRVNDAASEELKQSRLAICFAVGRVLEKGLGLLGIGVVPRM
ncbi:MAG: arginine--tRNA ligase [Planctomycetota bacterium]